MKSNSYCIIIPAFNEEGSILSVISALKKLGKKYYLIVVNDGSADKTKGVAEKAGAKVLDLPVNLGIGGAVQTGLKYARENGFEFAVQVDADGQHDPKYLPELIAKLRGYDMVIGSRYLKKTTYKTPFLRLLGIKIFSFLIQLTCKQKVYDSTSGYRVFGKRAIEFLSENYPQEFPEPLSIVLLLKNGYKIREVPTEMKQRTSGKSSVTPFYSVYLMLSISIAILLETIKTDNKSYE